MRDYFDVDQYIKKLEQSESIQSCETVPVPDIAENQNYIFISYSHKDYKKVYADLAFLYRAGVRFWYDRGLPAGKNWDLEVKERIESPKCSGVIFYLSENMFLSKSVNTEVNLVCGMEQQARKNYFCVNLSDGLPKNILRNIMRMDDTVLENAGLDMDRIGVLANAFSDRQTYLQQNGLGHRRNLLGQIKEQFDVMEEAVNKREFLVHEESNTVVEIKEDVFQIGRKVQNACMVLVQDDPAVSGIHACIYTYEDRSTVADLGAVNGTFLNGQKLERKTEVPIKHGDILQMGNQKFTFRSGDFEVEPEKKEPEKLQ